MAILLNLEAALIGGNEILCILQKNKKAKEGVLERYSCKSPFYCDTFIYFDIDLTSRAL